MLLAGNETRFGGSKHYVNYRCQKVLLRFGSAVNTLPILKGGDSSSMTTWLHNKTKKPVHILEEILQTLDVDP